MGKIIKINKTVSIVRYKRPSGKYYYKILGDMKEMFETRKDVMTYLRKKKQGKR